MEFFEIFAKILSSLAIVLSFVFGKHIEQIINYKQNNRLRKILNAKEIDFLIDKFDDDFKKSFIIPDAKVNFFYMQTSIYTNEESIDKYIALKNKLGKNFTWETIKTASPYLKFKDDSLTIVVTKFETFMSKLLLSFAMILILISFIFIIFYSNEFEYFSKKDILKLCIIIAFPIICALFMLYSITPLLKAVAMVKSLKQ